MMRLLLAVVGVIMFVGLLLSLHVAREASRMHCREYTCWALTWATAFATMAAAAAYGVVEL